MNIFRVAFSGEYEVTNGVHEADIVIGHSFGTNLSPDGVNRQIAEQALLHANNQLPVVVDETLAKAFPSWAKEPALVVGGPISTTLGKGTGTWGVLLRAKDYMKERGYERPVMVGQAFHIGRVALQGMKLGMHPIVPPDLPKQFDKDSAQVWTRSRGLWILREMAGIPYLRLKGQI